MHTTNKAKPGPRHFLPTQAVERIRRAREHAALCLLEAAGLRLALQDTMWRNPSYRLTSRWELAEVLDSHARLVHEAKRWRELAGRLAA